MQINNRQSRSTELGARVLNSTLTPDARDWVIAALDPFHDFQRALAGYPDTDSCNTIVACYQSEIDVVKPAGVVGNWDSHIFTTPLIMPVNTFQVKSSVADSAFISNTPGNDPDPAQRVLGSLNIWSADAGQPLFPKVNAQFAPTNFATQVFDTSGTVGTGLSRVIAWGFEIVNTTADLTKQGALTAYRMPQMETCDDSVVPLRASATALAVQRNLRFRSLPSTPAEALLLGGSRQWAAADGVYMVVPQATVQNPLIPATNQSCMFSINCPVATGEYALLTESSVVGAPNNQPVPSLLVPPIQKYVPFNSCGVYLSGLSSTTSFRVKMKMYVEKAPTFAEPQISVLATPSAPYDAQVLQLYSSALTQLPIAVPVAMNGFGDWFKMILGVVSDVAPVLGGSIMGPPGALLGGSLAALTKGISNMAFKDETKQAMHKMETEKQVRNAATAPKPVGRVRKPVGINVKVLKEAKRRLRPAGSRARAF